MNEVLKAKKGIQESKDLYHESYLTKLPEKGSSVEDMKELIENYMKVKVVLYGLFEFERLRIFDNTDL